MLHRLTITGLAGRLASGEVSATDALEACLAQVDRVDGEVKAFLSMDREDARRQAREADVELAAGRGGGTRPLLGVPIALKDVLCHRGQPVGCASRILEGYVSPYDATVVARLKAAGAVLFGRLNMDEFAMGSSTENSAYWTTLNPWDTARIPGGSSGGCAAAVAANEAFATIGSDTGGSIRQPAALCGCVGLKPTYGRVSRHGLVAFASSLDQIGPFTKTVGDAALVMEAISGHDPLDSTSLDEPVPRYREALGGASLKGVKLGVVKEFQLGGMDPEVDAAFRAAVRLEPRYVGARGSLAQVLRKMRDYRGAIAEGRATLAQRSDDPDALHALGMSYAALGQRSDARRYLEAFIRVKPEYEAGQEAQLILHLLEQGHGPVEVG